MRRTADIVVVALALACSAPRAESGGVEPAPDAENRGPWPWPHAAAGDLRFEATATVDPTDSALIRVQVTITNTKDTPCQIAFSAGDNVRLRLYASPERTGAAVWDSETRDRPDLRTDDRLAIRIPGYVTVKLLSPGYSEVFQGEFKVFELAQGSLPERRYYVTAHAKLDEPQIIPEIPAGAIDLWRPSTIHVGPFHETK